MWCKALIPIPPSFTPPPQSPSARKESRYREPPPTPPGYTALTISDFSEGQTQSPPTAPAHSARRPPDYTTALQRSRMVTQSPDSHHHHQAQQHAKHQGLHRTRSPGEEEEPEEEEEGESLSPKLVALRKTVAHTPETTRP